MGVRSSVFVAQLEGEGHGRELGTPCHMSCAPGGSRVRPSHPPRRATRETASPRRVGGASLRERAKVASTQLGEQQLARQLRHLAPERTINWMRQPTTILMAMARSRRSALWCWSSSTLQPT